MVDSDLVDDLAQRLAAQCKGQQLLKDAGIDPALRIAEQHSATSARFVQALTQLLRYKMDTARAEEEMGRAVCAAVETRRATFTAGYGALSLGHPLLANAVESGTDSEGLLRALAGEADAALTRARKAVGAMPPHNELLTLQEDAWREHALARDQARQEHVHFAELHLAGLRAKKDCLLRAFRSLKEDAIELPEPVGSIAQINVEDAVGAATQVRRILYTRSEGPTHIPRASLDLPPRVCSTISISTTCLARLHRCSTRALTSRSACTRTSRRAAVKVGPRSPPSQPASPRSSVAAGRCCRPHCRRVRRS